MNDKTVLGVVAAIIAGLFVGGAGGLVWLGRLDGRVGSLEAAKAEGQTLSAEVRSLSGKVDNLIGRLDERDRAARRGE